MSTSVLPLHEGVAILARARSELENLIGRTESPDDREALQEALRRVREVQAWLAQKSAGDVITRHSG